MDKWHIFVAKCQFLPNYKQQKIWGISVEFISELISLVNVAGNVYEIYFLQNVYHFITYRVT